MKFIFLIFFTIHMVRAVLESFYERTEVIQENYTCTMGPFNKYIELTIVPSLAVCGYGCSMNSRCRRIMFNTLNQKCFMYESGENCYASTGFDQSLCFRQVSHCDESRCPRCPIGYYGNKCQQIIKDCTDGYTNIVTVQKKLLRSYIQPNVADDVIEVKCVFDWGGLTIISHRLSHCSDVQFNNTWDAYSAGFGNKHGNYWIGLKHMYNILQNNPSTALSVVALKNYQTFQGRFEHIQIADETNDYAITISGFYNYSDQSKALGKTLINAPLSINGRPFSTYDRDFTVHNCPMKREGGWWFADHVGCTDVKVTGSKDDLIWLNSISLPTRYTEIQLILL